MVSTETLRAIAKEAYVYGFPMVDSYRIQHAYFVDPDNREYKAPWNELTNIPRVYTPADRAVQTPNSDTPYSMMGFDLRTEPMVLTVPAIEASRYYSIQLVDLYTHNFDYIGSRTTGNGEGSFLLAGPGWSGETPPGITKVLRSETALGLVIYRTQLFEPADLENVKRIQAGYLVRPLSTFLGTTSPPAAPEIAFIDPLSNDAGKTSLDFYANLNFLLQFCPTVPSERELMQRFASAGIGAGRPFDAAALSTDEKTAFTQGMADAWADYEALRKRIDAGELTSGDLFGTREALENNYLYRMAAAKMGIYGNSKQEAMYPIYTIDSDGRPLDATKDRYTLHFAAGQLPPVKGFWSVTMYELPSSLLVANPLDRYLLNSTMLPQFGRDADGGITLLVQHDSPGKDLEPNWLPAPAGAFVMAMRLYWPEAAALEGAWTAPPLQKLGSPAPENPSE